MALSVEPFLGKNQSLFWRAPAGISEILAESRKGDGSHDTSVYAVPSRRSDLLKTHSRALTKLIHLQFEKLALDLATYRATMERIFSWKLSRPRDCRKYFLELLLSASQLYLDYLWVLNTMPKLEKVARAIPGTELLESDIRREALLRQRFRERLESLPCWACFEPENAFAEYTGLWTLEDYINSFALHLPEIHEETFRVEKAAKIFGENQDNSALPDLTVGLQHPGRNHISFVHFALEWAADEGSWRT